MPSAVLYISRFSRQQNMAVLFYRVRGSHFFSTHVTSQWINGSRVKIMVLSASQWCSRGKVW